MSTEQPEEEVPQSFDGPDPRHWRGSPDIWGVVEDIKVIDEVLPLLNMPGGYRMSPAHQEALRFLAAHRVQSCELLAAGILMSQGVPLPQEEAEPDSPFSQAGKPRAFGAESPPPPATP